MMTDLATESVEEKTAMIDKTYLKARRTAGNSGFKKAGAGA